ncbi:MAG: DUF421 domain-containing protein [Clostridia bacterium]|nr:DUF421 domain-containing protein [Clostridia bacterium]
MTITFIRTIILYLITIIALRIMGKRQLGELSPTELVVTILISDLAAIPMQDNGTPLLIGIIPILTLLSLEIITSSLALKSSKCKKILFGENSMLILNGKINQQEMKRLRLTLDELLEELRLNGYTSIDKIRYAILETNGKLTVIPYAKYEAPTREDMKIKNAKNALPLSIISDGNIAWNNIYKLNKNKTWLVDTLKKHGYKKARDVFLMQMDEDNNVTIIAKE